MKNFSKHKNYLTKAALLFWAVAAATELGANSYNKINVGNN